MHKKHKNKFYHPKRLNGNACAHYLFMCSEVLPADPIGPVLWLDSAQVMSVSTQRYCGVV